MEDMPTTPEAHNAAKHESLKQELRKISEEPATQNSQLKEIIHSNYREGATVGSGSTADAIRSERATGQPTKGRWHTQKGEETISRLSKWLRENPEASPGDRAAAENVIKDLENALGR